MSYYESLWHNQQYVRTFSHVLLFLAIVAAVSYYMQRSNPKWLGAWASVKSYIITAPIIFLVTGLEPPWAHVSLVMFAIYGMKTFFRMTGMYHRSWFVWASYSMIALQGYLVYKGDDRFFNVMPLAFCLGLTLIPMLRNSPTRMIQYMALTLMGSIYFGWGFLHLGRMLHWEHGMFIILYLVIVSEFSENMLFVGNRLFGKHRPLSNVTSRFTVEGFIFSLVLSLVLAWALRGMLPHTNEFYWLSTGLICSVWGRIGSFAFSFMRRDLGVKESGVFIIGRADILSRLDKLMFVAPAAYYNLLILQGMIVL